MRGVKLFDAGYRDLVCVVPPTATLSPNTSIKPEARGKVPGLRGANGWYGYNFVTAEPPTRDQVMEWATWGANVGLLAARFPGLDIDSESPALTALVASLAEDILGDAPVRLSRGARRLRVYRTDEPFPRMALKLLVQTGISADKSHIIEFLGIGRQYLVNGKHPSGTDYRWEGAPLWEWDTKDLALVTRDRVVEFFDTLHATLAEKLPNAIIEAHGYDKGVMVQHPVDQAELLAPSFGHLLALVGGLPNTNEEFPSRDSYIAVGHAIKAAAGAEWDQQALDLFAEWASKWPGNENAPGGNTRDGVAGDWERMSPPFRIGWLWLVDLAARMPEAPPGPVRAQYEFQAEPGLVAPDTERRHIDASADIQSPSEAPTRPVYDWDVWRPNPPSPARWFVPDFLEEGTKGWLYGDGGATKSWIAYNLALRLAAGTGSVYGRPVTQQCAVYYVRGEGSERDTHKCLTRLADTAGDGPVGGRLAIDHSAYNLANADDRDELTANIERVSNARGWGDLPLLIFIDTFAEFLGGQDDSDAVAVKTFQRHIDDIRDAFDATIVILHHPRKIMQGAGADKLPSLRGRSELRNWADFAIGVVKVTVTDCMVGDEQGREVIAQVYCDKQRELEFNPFASKLTVSRVYAAVTTTDSSEVDAIQQARRDEKENAILHASVNKAVRVLADHEGEAFTTRDLRDILPGDTKYKNRLRDLLLAHGVLEERERKGSARQFVVTAKVNDQQEGEE